MSAIATVLARMGHRVTGSDLKDSRSVERLRTSGVDVHIGHDAANVPEHVDAVVVSTAIPAHEPGSRGSPTSRPARAAARRGTARRSSRPDGPSRSPGATARRRPRRCSRSASAAPGWQPSFLIGGDVNEVGTNAAYDDGEWLVVEADESDGTFLELAPEAAIVTNIEPDHLDHYGGFDALVDAFSRFIDGVPARGSSASTTPSPRSSHEGSPDVVTYGEDAGRALPGRRLRGRARRQPLRAAPRQASCSGPLELPVPGRHNALERGRCGIGRPRARRAVRRDRPRARRVRWRCSPVPVPRRSSTGSRSWTTTRTSPARSPR